MFKSRNLTILIFSLLLTLVLSYPAAAEPRQVILTWQDDPHTTMTITFRTDSSDPGYLYYAPEKDAENYEKFQTEPFTFPETEAWIHTVELRDLKPDSRYRVVLGNENKELDPFYFKTAPTDPREITFLLGADSNRAEPETQREVNQLAASLEPEFVIFSGDLINEPLNEEEWDRWFDDWHELMITDNNRRIPIIPAIGNHEVNGMYHQTPDEAVYYLNRFALPDNRRYYYLEYGPMGIITLDSGHATPVSEQTGWLEQTLKENQDQPWLIAQQHVACWGGRGDIQVRSSSPARAISEQIRREWVPLFERYGVDLVNEGHEHTCKITVPMANTGQLRHRLEGMARIAIARANRTYDPEENYSPWMNPTLQKLSQGHWKEAGFNSMIEGVLGFFYQQALYGKQGGNLSLDMVLNSFGDSSFYTKFWHEIGDQPDFEHLTDPEKGVIYVGDGGWGGNPLNAPRPASENWYLEEVHQKYHVFLATLSSDWDEMNITPVFLDGSTGETHTIEK